MSVLEHFCLDCEHRVANHDVRNQRYTQCGCCNAGPCANPSPPRLMATFALPGHVPEPLYPPGSERNSGSMHRSLTCSCRACHEAYAQLSGVEAAS